VHISELGKDYYQFDAAKHQLLGERTGQRYRLGDRVQVRVVKVDMESTKIDFVLDELIEETGHAHAHKGHAPKGHDTRPPKKSAKGKTGEKKHRG